MTQTSTAARQYSPLYFLAALGAGGLAITFFMYLMFWVPHPGRPVPIFEDIMAYLGTAPALGQAAIYFAMGAIALFAVLHFSLLIWNLRHFAQFRHTEAYAALTSSNAETQQKAIPLTLAMSVNVGFIVGLVFVPQLWTVVEYLFPFAMAAFLTIGIYAFKLLGRFFGRVFTEGGFDHAKNNSFAQLLPAFALSMVGVGLAAPSAMSTTPWIVGTSEVLATFFVIAAIIVTIVALVQAVIPMLTHGTAAEAAPTLMVVIPIMTVLGIAFLRTNHGLHTTFETHATAAETFMMLTRILSVQVLFLLLGMLVLTKQGYGKKFLSAGGTRSAGSYALVCPGVALSVMWQFWVHKGLIAVGLLAKFSVAYWIILAPAFIAQFAMIVLVLRLHKLHFSGNSAHGIAVPAE